MAWFLLDYVHMSEIQLSSWYIFGGTVGFHTTRNWRKHESQPQTNIFTALLFFNLCLLRKAYYTVNTVSKSLNYSIHYRMVVEKQLHLVSSGLVALNDSNILFLSGGNLVFFCMFWPHCTARVSNVTLCRQGLERGRAMTWACSLLPKTKILQPLMCH